MTRTRTHDYTPEPEDHPDGEVKTFNGEESTVSKVLGRKPDAGPAVPLHSSSSILSPRSLPTFMKFPLLVISNLALSATFYSLAANYIGGDLSSVSKSVKEVDQLLALLFCKTLEHAVGWIGQYDVFDLASLVLVSHTPPLFLLSLFYNLRFEVTGASLLIDVLAIAIPFYIFQPVAPSHTMEPQTGTISNRSIINDLPIQAMTSVLGTVIFAVVVSASFATWLPQHLILYFDGLKDLGAVYNSQLLTLATFLVPVGMALKTYLFTPPTAARPSLADIKKEAFNPETASFGETMHHNFWNYSVRNRSLIERTVVLASVTFINSWLQVLHTIQGAESYGAAGWASVWSIATVLTGAAYWWVADL